MRKRGWKRAKAEQVFEVDFAEALAIYLHEHAHIFGHDGDREFTDTLTELIENVVRVRRELDGYEARWETTREKVLNERTTQSREASTASLQERLAAMSEGEVRSLLNQVPGVVARDPTSSTPLNLVLTLYIPTKRRILWY